MINPVPNGKISTKTGIERSENLRKMVTRAVIEVLITLIFLLVLLIIFIEWKRDNEMQRKTKDI